MVRKVRLVSGLLLLLFVLTHFLNHSLGLVSLEAMERARTPFVFLWRSIPGSVVLYLSLLTHLLLALWSLYERRSFRLRNVDWLQLILGFSIPLLLVIHILGTRISNSVYGVEDNYLYELMILFVFKPERGLLQILLLMLVWLHAMIGLHQWLRLKASYRRLQWLAFSVALLIPTLAIAGVGVAARDVRRLAEDPAWFDGMIAHLGFLSDERVDLLLRAENWILATLGLAVLAVLCARPLREALRRRQGVFKIKYPDGKQVRIIKGTTILEASRQAAIPHASVCGGRGRCSTCRVHVVSGLEVLPPASIEEMKVLSRLKAGENVRLACQTRPEGDCAIVPLLAAGITPEGVAHGGDYRQGQEREVVVLFADLRGFTTISEDKLPYDVVFILNRYFAAMGEAIEGSGGYVDKFIGDGVMALFGLEEGRDEACRSALAATRAMARALEGLNEHLQLELSAPLRIGIGLHFGPAIVGEMGHGMTRHLTAVGDTVNTASRLEGMTKEFGVQLIMSHDVGEIAGLAGDFELREITLRGRSEPLRVRLIPDAQAL